MPTSRISYRECIHQLTRCGNVRGKVPIKIPDDARTRAIASIEPGPTVYNQAISDARSYCEEQTADLGAIYHQAEFPHWDTRKRTKEC